MGPKNYVQNPDYMQQSLFIGEDKLEPEERRDDTDNLDKHGKKRGKIAKRVHENPGDDEKCPVNEK